MKAIRGNTILDSYLSDITNDQEHFELYPFRVRVGCVKMCAPRHERFDFIREIGAGCIDAVFTKGSRLDAEQVFMFPERYMSVHEQQNFMNALEPHTEIKTVDILTSSPLILQNIHNEMMLVLVWEDDEKHNGIVK